jgi:hypothetical protein
MSYTSHSEVPVTTKLSQLQDIIDLLGYKKIRSDTDVQNMVGSYYWYEEVDYKSWSGVELQVSRADEDITIDTRSTVSRSYWDLMQQNKTIKVIRDIFGGHFTTDAGSNKYWRPDGPPPSPMSSGCYLARWRFHNALQKVKIYLMARKLEGDLARDMPTGFYFMDEINPRLLSNNLLIPYVIAVWEEYFRSTFTAVLKYSTQRESVFKKARLGYAQLEKIAIKQQPTERTIAECFSFQRPSMITENFKLLDPKLDIGGAIRKPYRRRKLSLYDSIEELVEGRNEFVHVGTMDLSMYDKNLKTTLDDIVEAVNRAYAAIGRHYRFSPIHDY